MATLEELRAAITDYVEQAHKVERVMRLLRHWSCLIAIEAVDIGEGFTLHIADSHASLQEGLVEKADLIVQGSSDDLTDIFWCDVNPTSAYIQGAIKTSGSVDHVLRLDAVSLCLFLALNKE